MEERLIKQSTTDTFAAVCARAEAACAASGFSIVGTIDMAAKLRAKGFALAADCTLFEVCAPAMAHTALTASLDIASAMPCRVAVYTEGGMTVLSTLRPSLLLAAYELPLPQLAPMAAEIDGAIRRIVAHMAEPPAAN